MARLRRARHHAGMRIVLASCTAALLGLAAAAAPALQAGTVTIYRCVDGNGRVMLRDSPCPRGQQQETRQMVRPQDGPTRLPATVVQGPSRPQAGAAPQVLVLTTPQPMYECMRPDGGRYTSDSSEGNPRWVPAWTLGWPVLAEQTVVVPGRAGVEVRDGRVAGQWRSGHLERRVVPTPAGYGAGTWVRDRCQPLPPSEACARLRDDRQAIRTRFFNAQPTERDQLRLRERAINARLANDCGMH